MVHVTTVMHMVSSSEFMLTEVADGSDSVVDITLVWDGEWLSSVLLDGVCIVVTVLASLGACVVGTIIDASGIVVCVGCGCGISSKKGLI